MRDRSSIRFSRCVSIRGLENVFSRSCGLGSIPIRSPGCHRIGESRRLTGRSSMRIMDRLSRMLSDRAQPKSEPESLGLAPVEIRLIIEGNREKLADFAASSRLLAVDPKGDTPLHLAARTGNLAVCDLFVRSGSDPKSLNHDRQTPADVAFAEAAFARGDRCRTRRPDFT